MTHNTRTRTDLEFERAVSAFLCREAALRYRFFSRLAREVASRSKLRSAIAWDMAADHLLEAVVERGRRNTADFLLRSHCPASKDTGTVAERTPPGR